MLRHTGGEEDAALRKYKPETVSRVIRLFEGYKKQVILTIITVFIGVLVGLLPPLFLKVIIDKGIQASDLSVTTQFSIYTIIATIVGAALTLGYGYLSVVVGQKIMCDLRYRLFDHMQGMSLRFFTGTRSGEIQTRLINDVSGVQSVVSTTATDALSNAAIVISALIAMFLVDWRLTLLSIGLIPFFALVGAKIGAFARSVRKGIQEQTAELNVMMQENLSVSGLLLTKTTGRRDNLTAKFDVESHKLAGWQIKAEILQYVFFAMIRMITSLTPVLVYWFAGYLIFRGDVSITVGTIVAFTMLQTRMFFPLTGLLNVQVEFMSSMALFDRIFEYLDMKQEIVDKPDAIPLKREDIRGEVTYENVSFRYDPENPKPTLSNISFSAQPGQLIAIVGPSGAGKTTLTYLIPRLYDVESGSVKIDDNDVRDIKLQSLAEIVGAVTQETYLIHATVNENLRIAKPEATDEEIIEACKTAAIHDHIASLPEAYETKVGERGYKLSGGEKQRLAIARAILKNPKILVLDEATSALDTRSERLIQNALGRLMEGRTTFAIAHRLSTILAADLILVLKDGEIVERGQHAELLKQDGLYARLYEEQFLHAKEQTVEA